MKRLFFPLCRVWLVCQLALLVPLGAGSGEVAALREAMAAAGVRPVEPSPGFPQPLLKLGQALFFDPVLGGNRDVSCATCHHPSTATADGRSRAVGTQAYADKGKRLPTGFSLIDVPGGDQVLAGFGVRGAGHPFTPRNSPDLFNRGDSAWRTMFWDSRAERLEDGRFVIHQARLTKAPGVFQVVMPDSIQTVLAAQAMMPVLSDDEMRGAKGQKGADGRPNEVGEELRQNEEKIWGTLLRRVLEIDEYRAMFAAAYPEKRPEELHFADAANAIAAFEIDSFTFTDSPWDRFVAGEDDALSADQLAGARLFFGRAGCAACHSGPLLTDQKTYNIGVIPIGPGPDMMEDADYGVTHRSHGGPEEKYHFRTPPLRNVELTGPYLHNGAYATLEAAVEHHTNPLAGLLDYDDSQLEPEFRGGVLRTKRLLTDVRSTLSEELNIVPDLGTEEVTRIVDFLRSLTSPQARDLRRFIPERVPSGLELVDPVPRTGASD